MDHKTLSNLTQASRQHLDVTLPQLSDSAQSLLNLVLQSIREKTQDRHYVLHYPGLLVDETLHINNPSGSSSIWYEQRKIGALIIEGDLTIDGDLIDDYWEQFLFLIVTGNLRLRNWLRGGMTSFIGGDLVATGYLACEYNDGGLFVGGDLQAAGYIHSRRPYPDMADLQPHQIGGRILAPRFDMSSDSLTLEDIGQAFDPDALEQDEDGNHCYSPWKILERSTAGLPVWRKQAA